MIKYLKFNFNYNEIIYQSIPTFRIQLANGNLAVGEMVMSGRVAADNNQATNGRRIAKLTKRIATDFAGARYKWSMADDSSSDDILLVAL